jgi:hypothetical protein
MLGWALNRVRIDTYIYRRFDQQTPEGYGRYGRYEIMKYIGHVKHTQGGVQRL